MSNIEETWIRADPEELFELDTVIGHGYAMSIFILGSKPIESLTSQFFEMNQ
jgi:hypothetical protein